MAPTSRNPLLTLSRDKLSPSGIAKRRHHEEFSQITRRGGLVHRAGGHMQAGGSMAG
jgi:hypothetical protein